MTIAFVRQPTAVNLGAVKLLLRDAASVLTPEDAADMQRYIQEAEEVTEKPYEASLAKTLFRMFRASKYDYNKIIETMKNVPGLSASHMTNPNFKLFCLHPKNFNEVIVFAEASVGLRHFTDTTTIGTSDGFMKSTVYSEIRGNIDAQSAKHEKAKQAWEGRNGFKRIRKYTVMSIDKFLTNHLFQDAKPHLIRTLGQLIASIKAPIKFVEADTPVDFKAIYDYGTKSCMTSHESANRDWDSLNSETQPFAPSMAYAYMPRTAIRLFAVQRGAITLARTLVQNVNYNEEATNKLEPVWRKVREYSIDTGASELLNAELKKLLKAPKDEVRAWHPGKLSFKLPVYGNGKKRVVPWPYMDSLGTNAVGNFYGVLINDNKEVYIEYRAAGSGSQLNTTLDGKKITLIALPRGSTAGILDVSYLTVLECSHCGTKVKGADAERSFFHKTTGDYYCTQECIQKAGKIRVKSGDGALTVADIETAIERADSRSEGFSNFHVAVANGFFVQVADPLIKEENPAVVVRRRDDYYMIPSAKDAEETVIFHTSSNVEGWRDLQDRAAKLRLRVEGLVDKFSKVPDERIVRKTVKDLNLDAECEIIFEGKLPKVAADEVAEVTTREYLSSTKASRLVVWK